MVAVVLKGGGGGGGGAGMAMVGGTGDGGRCANLLYREMDRMD